MSSLEERRLEVDAVEFQIACRRFTIRANITRDRQLPVVDEFLLRMLAVIERMPFARMRAWFGFSEAEMEAVLLDMGRRALVEFDGDDILLAPAGRELFRAVPDGGVPRIVEVASLVDSIWFDLVSRNMVPKSGRKSLDYLVRLREDPAAREFPASFAREAFETNFRDYARHIRRLPDADAVNIYSVSDVEGGTYGFQTLRAAVHFDPQTMSLRPTFPDLADKAGNFQKLTVAATEAWQTLSAPEGASAAAVEYVRLTGDGRLTKLINAPAVVDVWRETVAEGAQHGLVPILGATYLDRNTDRLLRVIPTSGLEDEVAVTWLRPSGTIWGRTTRVAEITQSLREAVRNAGGVLTTTLAIPRAVSRDARKDHRRLFDRGVLLPQGHLPANLEVLLVAKVAALVVVHVPTRSGAVAIGSLVDDKKRLDRIMDRLQPRQEGGWEDLWQASKPSEDPAAEQDDPHPASS